MDGLVIGLDLCDAYTQISCFEQEKSFTIPTVICKKKNTEEWYVGEEAYGFTLLGEGIIVDKLLKLVLKDGTATISGVKYTGFTLLSLYLLRALELPQKEWGCTQIKQLVITLQSIDVKLMDALLLCTDELKIPRDKVHLISHSESFIYYTLSQKKEVWSNQVGMFELAEERLCYYELKVQRGIRQMSVLAEYENLEEGFNLDILDTPSGTKLADKILCSCGERLLQKKLFSAVFLTGKGFKTQKWATEFMKFVCTKRRVYAEDHVFSQGAAFKAADYLNAKSVYPFVCICEGRLMSTISISVLHKDKESQLTVAAAGDNWYESKSTVELIVNNQKEVDFTIVPTDPKKKRIVRIPLENFPKRPDKTTRIQIQISFLDEKTMVVVIRDKGFGELFPAGDAMVRQEVMI